MFHRPVFDFRVNKKVMHDIKYGNTASMLPVVCLCSGTGVMIAGTTCTTLRAERWCTMWQRWLWCTTGSCTTSASTSDTMTISWASAFTHWRTMLLQDRWHEHYWTKIRSYSLCSPAMSLIRAARCSCVLLNFNPFSSVHSCHIWTFSAFILQDVLKHAKRFVAPDQVCYACRWGGTQSSMCGTSRLWSVCRCSKVFTREGCVRWASQVCFLYQTITSYTVHNINEMAILQLCNNLKFGCTNLKRHLIIFYLTLNTKYGHVCVQHPLED